MLIKIDYLANHLQHCQQVVNWVWDTWDRELGYVYEDMRREFFRSAQTDSIPLTVIALDGDAIVGMAALLKVDYIDRPEYTPWVTDIYVEPSRRNEGIGAQLFNGVNEAALKLGYKKTYLWADAPQRYLDRPELYIVVGNDTVLDKPITIFEIDLEKAI